jgi:hypothetical protein
MKHSPVPASPLERLRAHLVGLKMARALEVLETLVGQLEQGQLTALEALEWLLAEEHTQRETRRIRMALITARLTPIKTLESFDSIVSDKIESNSILTTRCPPAHASCPELMGQFLLVSPSHPGPQKYGRHRAYRSRPVPFPQICPE